LAVGIGADPPSQETIRNALTAVIDPELGDNIVELGMVRDIQVGTDGLVTVTVALTVAGCPLQAQLRTDVVGRVESLRGVTGVKVQMGEMDPEEKAALMARARWKAREKGTVTDIPPSCRVVAVASGKGGVGKSSVTANLAVALAARGLTVGVLDADIWGFSLPRMLGMSGEPAVVVGPASEDASGGGGRDEKTKKMVPLTKAVGPGLLKVLSMGFLRGAEEDEAIMWRGLILNRALQHFLEDVQWGEMDYLLIDMPPGTGDVQMGLARMLPRADMLIVTTPALAAQKVASRAADMARRGYLRVAGVIENMTSFTCEHGETYNLFGEGGGARLAHELGVPLLAQVPLEPSVALGGDNGIPAALTGPSGGPAAAAFATIAERLVSEVCPLVELSGCSARILDSVEAALDAAEAAAVAAGP
jgi:ATP-binding protein involved in chromosome partitioning